MPGKSVIVLVVLLRREPVLRLLGRSVLRLAVGGAGAHAAIQALIASSPSGILQALRTGRCVSAQVLPHMWCQQSRDMRGQHERCADGQGSSVPERPAPQKNFTFSASSLPLLQPGLSLQLPVSRALQCEACSKPSPGDQH